MSREICRLLGRHWEEYALWLLLDENFSMAETVYRLAEHVSAVTEPGTSRLMARYVELLLLLRFEFLAADLEDQLEEFVKDEIDDEDSQGWKTSSGLYIPGGLIK